MSSDVPADVVEADGDTDGAGDACDVCTGVAQVTKPSLMLTKLLASMA